MKNVQTRRQQKAEAVRLHNEKYAREKARWDALSWEEQKRELIVRGVKAGIELVRKDMELLLGRKQATQHREVEL
jgi:ABC-type molybdenum transport system ATPase subunit/photorepair protein PhrA